VIKGRRCDNPSLVHFPCEQALHVGSARNTNPGLHLASLWAAGSDWTVQTGDLAVRGYLKVPCAASLRKAQGAQIRNWR